MTSIPTTPPVVVPLKRVYRCAVNTKPLDISSTNNLAGLSRKMVYSKKLQLSTHRGTRFWGLIKLNEFGSYNGAPGGAGGPPKNVF
jgi:hypothetical protein